MYKLFDLYFEFFLCKKHIEIDCLPIYFFKTNYSQRRNAKKENKSETRVIDLIDNLNNMIKKCNNINKQKKG
jgi:hypothetical protein